MQTHRYVKALAFLKSFLDFQLMLMIYATLRHVNVLAFRSFLASAAEMVFIKYRPSFETKNSSPLLLPCKALYDDYHFEKFPALLYLNSCKSHAKILPRNSKGRAMRTYTDQGLSYASKHNLPNLFFANMAKNEEQYAGIRNFSRGC
jgi:hypothetical protein